MTTSPHDALFKAAFGRPDIAASEIALVLPAEIVMQLDLAALTVAPGSFVDEELRHAHTDLLCTVPLLGGGEALVYILLEHQSSFDALMPLRLLRYAIRIWDQWLRDHPNAKRLPLVLPVVMHHGAESWTAAPEFASVLDAPGALIEATKPFVPHFRYALDDLSAKSVDDLAARSLHALGRLVQLAFWSARSHERLTRAAPLMQQIAAHTGDDASTRALLQQFYVYLFQTADADVDARDVRTILLEIARPEEQEHIMNAGEQLIAQGRAEGTVALRSAITNILAARGIPLSDLGQARLASCGDLSTLSVWAARAAVAASESDIFG